MRLSLRNLMWLMLLLAVFTAWTVEDYRAEARLQEVRQEPKSSWHYSEVESPANASEAGSSLQQMSDEELVVLLGGYSPHQDLDPLLAEAGRRGLCDELTVAYDKFVAYCRVDRNVPICGSRSDSYRRNIAYLTSLRRVHGLPDPLCISVRSVGGDCEGKPLSYPLIGTCIENVDLKRETCTLNATLSGKPFERDHHPHWRVLLTNERGELIKEVKPLAEVNTSHLVGLLPGDKIEDYALDARKYVELPPSGRYSLQLVFSDNGFRNGDDLSQQIVWKSEPVKVIVVNRTLSSQWESFIAPSVIFLCTLLAMITAGVRAVFRGTSLRASDWLAMCMLAVLTSCWALDLFRIKDEIAERTVDANSAWTMRLAD